MLTIDASQITDWDSFHDAFSQAFGFPEFYGRNLNAFVDCLTDLDDPDAGMTAVHTRQGHVFVITLSNADAFKKRAPEIYNALVESLESVNQRRIEVGEPAVVALSEL